MTEKELVRRADLALADLASGGLMQPLQAQRFIRKMQDSTQFLQNVRVVPMGRPKMEINKIGFTSRVLRAANQGTISSPTENGTRALVRADRAKPVTERITLDTKEVIAEIDIPYEVLEDNIEGGAIDNTDFEQTILDLLAQRVALDLEEALVTADTSSGDAYLALWDGILKQTVSNVVNHGGDPMSPELFANMIKALPTKYHRLLGQMGFYSSITKEIDYRMQVAQRQTALGDATLTGSAPVSVLGVPLRTAAYMPNSTMTLLNPKNLILGIQRNLRMETAKDARERAIIIVLSMRLDMKFEEEDMVVKAINVG